jgi:hypothetical protein
LDHEDIRELNIGPSGTMLKEKGYSNLVTEHGAQRACPKARCIGYRRAQTQIPFNPIHPLFLFPQVPVA